MSREAGLALLGLGAFVAPGVIVLLEWARTVMGILSLAPGVVYIPNGLETFYLALTAGAIVCAVPVTRSRIARGDYRLSKCFGTFLAMLIVWKVIDVTLLSEAGIEALESSGMTENIVLSIGTFGYAFVAALVFWSIAVRPQQRLASAPPGVRL
ncbi:MAG: hypothetical protein VW881_05110 [Alphaproteobacteria bacterium]